eukprot:315787-Rhodomonas_salina.3
MNPAMLSNPHFDLGSGPQKSTDTSLLRQHLPRLHWSWSVRWPALWTANLASVNLTHTSARYWPARGLECWSVASKKSGG